MLSPSQRVAPPILSLIRVCPVPGTSPSRTTTIAAFNSDEQEPPTLTTSAYPDSILRLLMAHVLYFLLPGSVTDEDAGSGCKVVYISQRPKYALVSTTKLRRLSLSPMFEQAQVQP